MDLEIEQYSFGKMTVNGREYTSDLIIHPDGRIEADWWRKQGHNLVPEDIKELLDEKPGRLIVGTGNSGVMKLSAEVLEKCRELGIEVEATPTKEAADRFNNLAEGNGSVAACFHLTC